MTTQTAETSRSSEREQDRRNHLDTSGDRRPFEDLVNYAREYAREQPEMAALWCLGIGFVLGWKLKPW